MSARFCTQVTSIVLAVMMGLGLMSLLGFTRPAAYAQAAADPTIGGCPIYPADNIWNTNIAALPVAANSAAIINSIGPSGHLHPDFGSGTYNGEPIGIPYVVVPANQRTVPVSFQYSDESDAGPYPIPSNAPIEGGANSTGDRHVLIVQSGVCKLYELYSSYLQTNGSWQAGSGAVWDLNSDKLRPSGWTSADAAGLPILPGLARYDEVASGVIAHALRFTVQTSRNTFVWPARHEASSSSSASYPPMGLRLRLKANVNISSFSKANQVILTALKQYGMMVADNGSNWYISGAPDNRWSNDDLSHLASIPGSDFEVVDTSSLMVSANSGQAKQLTPTGTVTATASAGALTASPNSSQSQRSGGSGAADGLADTSGTNLRLLFILVLGGLGFLLLVALAIRRRLQEAKRLAAEAEENGDI